MTQANSQFYLDYKVPVSVLRNETAPVPTPRDQIVDKVNQTTEDIRQMVAAKAWFYFSNQGLIEGDASDEQEESFRALLDSEDYRGFLYTMRKHTLFNELRTLFMEGASEEKKFYTMAMNAAHAVTDGGKKPLDKEYAARLVSLDAMMHAEWDDGFESDPAWEKPFEE